MSSTPTRGLTEVPAWETLRDYELPWDRLLQCFEGWASCSRSVTGFYLCRFNTAYLTNALSILAPGVSFLVPDSWSVSGYADLAELQRYARVIADRLSAFSIRVVGIPR